MHTAATVPLQLHQAFQLASWWTQLVGLASEPVQLMEVQATVTLAASSALQTGSSQNPILHSCVHFGKLWSSAPPAQPSARHATIASASSLPPSLSMHTVWVGRDGVRGRVCGWVEGRAMGRGAYSAVASWLPEIQTKKDTSDKQKLSPPAS